MNRACADCGYDPGFEAIVCPRCGSAFDGSREAGQANSDACTFVDIPLGSNACFFVRKGPDVGRQFPVGDVARIGRDSTCEVALADTRVSREHGRVKLVDGQFVYQDLQTSNGSFLVRNGREEPLRGPHVLRDSDELLLGGTVLRFITFAKAARS